MNKVSWKSPSNIALIKYWGKEGNQIPKNPSISFTLENSYTETSILFTEDNTLDKPEVSLLFEGKSNKSFEERIQKYITNILEFIPSLRNLKLVIESKNSFPHSTGIASSASAMSALALCMVSIEKELTGKLLGFDDFYKKSSFLARLGSGSAARSIYGGINLWGKTPSTRDSSIDYSIDITNQSHPIFKSYQDTVLIVSGDVKKVSSSVGHGLMNNHPFALQKFIESYKNTELMLEILKKGELQDFVNLCEWEALSLHAMMMTSNPNYLLMEPNTVAIIKKIQQYRQETGIQACFTLDAGANVHFLYPENDKIEVTNFIDHELIQFCSNRKKIDDKVGNGPIKIY